MITWKDVIDKGAIGTFAVNDILQLDPHENYEGQPVLEYIKLKHPSLLLELISMEPFKEATQFLMRKQSISASKKAKPTEAQQEQVYQLFNMDFIFIVCLASHKTLFMDCNN